MAEYEPKDKHLAVDLANASNFAKKAEMGREALHQKLEHKNLDRLSQRMSQAAQKAEDSGRWDLEAEENL